MEKRWYKISELVESLEFTKVEIIRACLDGKIPVYTPDGMQLFRVNIQLEEIPYQFLMEHRLTRSSKPLENELCRETLYSSYEDLKDCLISDDDKEAYLMGLPSIVEARTFRTQYYRKLAEHKLQADVGGMSNDAVPANAALHADTKIPAPKTLGALYSFILALAHEKGIDLAEDGLQKNLVLTAKEMGLPLSKGFVSETIKGLAEYENAHKG